jgi:hypothetical protein
METADEQGFRRDGAKVWDDNEQSRRGQCAKTPVARRPKTSPRASR